MKADSQLQRDVLEELEWDPRVDHADVGVSVVDGVVSLNGWVKSYAEKIAAETAARRVGGVSALAEELKIRHASDAKTADHEIAMGSRRKSARLTPVGRVFSLAQRSGRAVSGRAKVESSR